MYLWGLSLCLTVVSGIVPETSKNVDVGINGTTEANLFQGQTTLKDMFREVEELMEDTQHKLDEAVDQMENESAKSNLHVQSLPSNYHVESSSESLVGNQSIHIVERIDKVTDNKTGETHFSRTIIESSGKENNTDRECIINEDCEKSTYCQYETHSSKCLPCKQLDASCTKDEECCSGQLCVWGQCAKNVTQGEAGTICQYQTDCSSELCCAFHKALLFPVCSPKPMERERCYISKSHLMELLSWDMEGEGPREHCPCAGELQCQHLGRGSLCLQRQNSSEEDLTDALYSEIDYIV
ncbi:dickkopf-related protein 3a [Chanos chanos]|uniref:Dickkopf-related protein 3a n=1 Tax=Chanos chanos TaxID=29144 RepID=A0A6J2UQ95_CHACN|nr:dickkopf-related protein 3 [Chanos chanos]